MMTFKELNAKGLVTEHTIPFKNVIFYEKQGKQCPKCKAFFGNSYDFSRHNCMVSQKKEVLIPQIIETLGWRQFKHGNGEWIFRDNVPELAEWIKEKGPQILRGYKYRLSGKKFLVRKKIEP